MRINNKTKNNKGLKMDNKKVEVEGYKVEDKEILALIGEFYKATREIEHKKLLAEILDSKIINRDNASLMTLMLKSILDGDLYREGYQRLPALQDALRKLYNYLSEYFDVDMISEDIGYMCFDKKIGICSIYYYPDNNLGEVA